ncbi:MAG: sulfite exporter TauE/SafE family protein [Gammaproteobacteria bacterium]
MLVWVGALGIGLALGLLGGGGSILTVPLLVYGFGIETKAAMATSLLVVGVTSILTTIPYARRGQVCRRVGLLFGFAAMIGAYAGGWGARFIPAQALLSLFTAIMLATALAMLRSRPEEGGIAPPYASPCQKASTLPLARILVDGLLVGGATGLVGAGGGFLVVPALHLLGRLPMHAAIGTSLLVIAMKSFAGFAAYVQHVDVSYPLAGMLIVVASMGTLLGSLVANRVQSARLKQGFGIFVLSVAGYSLYRELPLAWLMGSVHEHPVLWLIGLALAAIALVIGEVLRAASRRTQARRA